MNTVTYRKYAAQFAAAKAAGTTSATSVKAFIAEVHAAPAAPVEEVVQAVAHVEEAPKRKRGRPANPNKVVKAKRVLKTHLARQIFAEEVAKANGGDVPRKALIERLVVEVGLSKNGANTYVTNLRHDAGLI